MIYLDLDKSLPAYGPVMIRTTDEGRAFEATILDHGASVDMSGYEASFHAIWEDGSATAPAEVGDKVTWKMPRLERPGRTYSAYLVFESETERISTQDMRIEVIGGAQDAACPFGLGFI